MTKNRIMRFATCLAFIVIAAMCIVTSGTQKVDTVKANTTVGPVTVVTEFEYNSLTVGDYVYMFKQGWMDIYNSIDPAFVSEGGKIFHIVVYEYDDVWLNDWDQIYDTGADIDDDSDDIGNPDWDMLPMYTYGVQYYWYSSGSYGSGYSGEDPIEITITPKDISHMYDSWEFQDCHYGDLDWQFRQTYWMDVQHNWNWEYDDVYLKWYYMDGEDEVEINELTDAGTYFIYAKLTGAHAERYTLGTLEYNDMMMGMSYITKDTPVEFTIEKKAIQPTVRYLGVTDLTMKTEADADYNNQIYYNGTLSLDAYYKEDANVVITIDKWRDTVEFEPYTDGISEIGTYFVKTANFILDEESAKNYTISSTKCNVQIVKRTVEVNIDWNAYYTSEIVVPEYYITPYLSVGETADMVMKPDLMVDDIGSTLVYEYGSIGHVIYDLIDTDHYEIYDTMNGILTTSVEADYYVDKGFAIIEFEQIEDWHYREYVDDLATKLAVTTTTPDPDEEVTIGKIEWTVEANIDMWTLWHDVEVDGYPQQYDLIWMESGVAFRITTAETDKFRPTEEIYRFTLEKAPVYVRVVNTDLTYNGEEQSPEYDNYRFYIYAPDIAENDWSLQTGLANLNELLDFVDEHLFTWEGYNVNAGTYNLKVSLVTAQEAFYTLMINDAEFDGTILDPEAVYEIKKAHLDVASYTIDDMTYGMGLYVQPHITVTGLIGDEEYDYEVGDQKWYYNMDSCYVADDEWISVDELPAMPHAGYYYIKYVAEFDNYETLTVYGYGDNYNLKINKREIEIKWYETESDAMTYPGIGIITGNSTMDYVATYTYNSALQMPAYRIFDAIPEDNLGVDTWNIRTKEGLVVTGSVDAGLYYVEIVTLTSEDYMLPNNYPTCIAMFEIERATLTVTPNAGQSKIFGEDDPVFAYTVTGAQGDDVVVVEGSVAREAGANIGNYEYNVGTLSLTDDNYTLEFTAPYTFEIIAKEITANFGLTTKEYTSENVNPDFTSFTGVYSYDADDVKIVYVNDTIDVGSYTKTFKLGGAKAGNYVLSTTTIGLTITQATMTYNAKLDGTNTSLTVEFNEQEHTLTVEPTGVKSQDGGRVGISITENATGTTAGTYYATLTLTGDKAGNYKLANDIVTWTITPKGVDISDFKAAFADTNVVYDGDSHTIAIVGDIPAHYTFEFWFGGEIFGGAIDVGTYNIQIVFTSEDENNYPAVPSISNKVVISPRTVTLTWGETTFTYDGTSHFPEVTLNNVVYGDKAFVTVDFDNDGATHKGSYNINAVNLYFGDEVAENYVLDGTTTHKTMTIEARAITVTADGKTTAYGDAIAELTAKVTTGTIVNGDNDVYSLSCIVKTTSNVGDYTINVIKGDNPDYVVTGVPGSYTVTARNITVTIDDKTSVYGNNTVALTSDVTTGSIVNDDEVYTLNCTVINTSPVGTYAISGTKTNNNYSVTFVPGTYTITKKAITVTIDNKTSVYGDAVKALTATTDVAPIGNDVPYTLECAVEELTEVGTYDITGKVNNTNYDVTFDEGTYNVTARPLTIAIADKTSVYGDARVKLTFSLIKGSYAGDDIANDVFKLNCVVTHESHVGLYNITGETTNNNYNVTYINGTLDEQDYDIDHGIYTVTKRAITITAENATSVYGNVRADLTAIVTAGNIVNDDEVYTLDAQVDTTTAVGEYVITVTAINNDYNVTTVPATYTVTKRNVTVTIHDKTSVYGDNLVGLTSESKNIVNGDKVYTIASVVTSTSDVGEYEIVGTATNNNYTVEFTNGTYTLTKRAITITIDNETSVYGDLIVPFANDITAGTIVEGDNPYTVACLNGEVDINNATPVGEYAIVGTCVDDNYDITFVNGTYTITKRAITVTADNQTSVYGDAIVNLTSTVTAGNIVNDDDVYTFTTTALTTSAVDTYPITGRAYNDNYDVTFVNGTYTVTVRHITVTIDNKTSVYGENAVALTSVVTTGSIVNGDEVYTLACIANSTSLVGTYAITGTKTNDNYAVEFVDGTYTITKRTVTLAWEGDTFVYIDGTRQAPTVTAGNLVNGDEVVVTVTGAEINAGSYVATASALSNDNYTIDTDNNTYAFIITKPASYNKPLDEKLAATGLNLTEVFNNIDTTKANAKLEIVVGDAKVEFDKEAIAKIAAGENVSFKFEVVDGDAAKEINKKAVAVIEVSLAGATFEDGTVTITADFENNAPFGKVAKVYFIDENGKKTDMKAVFADGKVTFTTNHFSTYAVVYTLSTLSIVLIIVLIVLVLAGGAVAVLIVLKKKGNKAPATPKEETKPATEETSSEDNTNE